VRKWAELQSDALEFRAGFDSKLYSSLTLAADFLGKIDLNADEAIHLAPGSATITDIIPPPPGGKSVRRVNLSNVPDRDNDNSFAMSLGFRFAPSDTWLLFANIMVPLNDGGLRASVAPTFGVSAIF
jgi:hypothetical protein